MVSFRRVNPLLMLTLITPFRLQGLCISGWRTVYCGLVPSNDTCHLRIHLIINVAAVITDYTVRRWLPVCSLHRADLYPH